MHAFNWSPLDISYPLCVQAKNLGLPSPQLQISYSRSCFPPLNEWYLCLLRYPDQNLQVSSWLPSPLSFSFNFFLCCPSPGPVHCPFLPGLLQKPPCWFCLLITLPSFHTTAGRSISLECVSYYLFRYLKSSV